MVEGEKGSEDVKYGVKYLRGKNKTKKLVGQEKWKNTPWKKMIS